MSSAYYNSILKRKRTNMKKYLLFFLAVNLSILGCRSQDKKTVAATGEEGKKIATFEERQKLALADQRERPEADAAATTFNFRLAARKATPGVVHVKPAFSRGAVTELPDFLRDFFDGDMLRQHFLPGKDKGPEVVTGSASGVIVSNDGYIVTNNHVVDNADSVEVVLHDQRNYKAKVVGADPATDLALLKIEEKGLSFIEFGNSDSVEVGDVVLAVGNPFNLASTVTAGIVSAKARNINILTDKSAVESYIQTDAAVNQGNSGGALVDINGKLVGINAAIATPTGAYAGYSFAIPVEMVKKTIDDLLRYGKVMRGYLGIVISDMNGMKARTLGIATATGVLVDSLEQNGAAIRAGVQKQDVITKIDNYMVETAPQLREIIARHKPGETLQLTIIRAGKERKIPVVLMAAKVEAPAGAVRGAEILKSLGIEIENLSAKDKSELQVGGGVRVKRIGKGKIAFNTDIREGFIITKVNGKPINTAEDFLRELKDKKGGVMLEGIYPGVSGVFYYAFGL
jgi:Do/DeqQ family serine protease